MLFVKILAAALIWATFYALTPDFKNVWTDGLVPVMLAAVAIALVFWIPLPHWKRPCGAKD